MDQEPFPTAETEERLEALYRPGAYSEGEELCLHILEELDPDWEPARLYLLLFLSAQDAWEEALELLDELEDESLFEVLRHLAFSPGTRTDCLLYSELQQSALDRGLQQELDEFFSTFEKPLARQDLNSALKAWS